MSPASGNLVFAVSHNTMRVLITRLAIRRFEIDQGRLPGSLEELAPRYLPAVPRDPFSGGPLVYRRSAEGYRLYSLGKNRLDDGGSYPADLVIPLLESDDEPARHRP